MEVAVGWKPINHKERLVFLGLKISMGLIIKKSIKAFWNTKDCSQNPATSFIWSSFYNRQVTLLLMLHFVLDFPENEGDSRKLKKVQELFQHFSEQCSHYVSKQNITYNH